MEPTETNLKSSLTAGVAGDEKAYRAFLLGMTKLLRRYIGRQLFRLRQTNQDAEDIVQDVLIALHNRRHTYDGETPVTAWAYGIARYKLIDSLRARKHDIDLRSIEDVEPAFDESPKTEARLVVQKIMSLIPDALRTPVQLVKLDGLSGLEAARRIGTSEVAVRIGVHRGLKALRRLCGDGGSN